MEGKVVITNMVNAQVGINLPDIHFKHTWEKRGDKFTVSHEIFEAMMYNNGARNIFAEGILYTEDMEVKKEFGLEPEDAEEPVNIIVLNEAQMKRYLTVMPYRDFKENLEKVSQESLLLLVQYAIDNKIMADIEKINYLRDKTGISILKAIEENQKDAVKKEV